MIVLAFILYKGLYVLTLSSVGKCQGRGPGTREIPVQITLLLFLPCAFTPHSRNVLEFWLTKLVTSSGSVCASACYVTHLKCCKKAYRGPCRALLLKVWSVDPQGSTRELVRNAASQATC